jgi:hypothetical protein
MIKQLALLSSSGDWLSFGWQIFFYYVYILVSVAADNGHVQWLSQTLQNKISVVFVKCIKYSYYSRSISALCWSWFHRAKKTTTIIASVNGTHCASGNKTGIRRIHYTCNWDHMADTSSTNLHLDRCKHLESVISPFMQ